MKRKTALKLIDDYSQELHMNGCVDETLVELDTRFPHDGKKEKAMRWLGFMQGVLWTSGVSLQELKNMNRPDDKDINPCNALDRW